MDSCRRLRASISVRILRLASLEVGVPPDEISWFESRSRVSVSCCRRPFMLKKQDGHAGHSGKLAQWPRLQVSQRALVTPGLQRHAPVRLSQLPDSVPDASQSHAERKEQETNQRPGLLICLL